MRHSSSIYWGGVLAMVACVQGFVVWTACGQELGESSRLGGRSVPIPLRSDAVATRAMDAAERLTVDDVLAWQRLAMQNSTAGPRIDGISSTEPRPGIGAADEATDRSSGGDAGSAPAVAAPPVDSSVGNDLISAATLQIPDDITPQELITVLRLLQRQVDVNTDLIRNNTTLAQKLSSRLDELTNSVNNGLIEQTRILQQQQQAIAAQQATLDSVTADADGGGRVLRLSGNMQLSREFVDDVDTAIKSRLPVDGAIVIRNPLGHSQVIVVNDQQHTVVAGATLTIRVPLGNVITRVPGGGTYSWFVSPTQHTIHLRLVP